MGLQFGMGNVQWVDAVDGVRVGSGRDKEGRAHREWTVGEEGVFRSVVGALARDIRRAGGVGEWREGESVAGNDAASVVDLSDHPVRVLRVAGVERRLVD